MAYYRNREERDAAAARQAAARREAAAAFPIVREIIEQFNGKVYNCRFDKALTVALCRKVPGRVSVRKDNYNFTVEYYPSGNTYPYSAILCTMKANDLIDGKRIDAKTLIASLKAQRESLLKEASAIEDQSAKSEEYRQQLEDLRRRITHITSGICYTVREIYDLNYSVRT